MTAEQYWLNFLASGRAKASAKFIEAFHFELTETTSNELLALVLSGKKRATSSSLYYYELSGLRIPQRGDCNLVTDFAGEPKCVIETTRVTVLPFKDITFEICRREGEDDTLASWQIGHRRFFTAEGCELGYKFSDDMPVVFEDFKIVY